MKTKFNEILTLLLAFVVQISFAQERTVSGTVVDESGPLPGVSVFLKGTTKGTETDFDGKYKVKAKTGDVLSFSFVGMKTVEKTVGEGSTVNVTLESANVLEEVVVVGYGTQKRSEVTGSVSQVKGDELANLNTPSFESQLAGKASGVQIIQNSGLIGAPPVVNIRGVNSINSGTQPLYVVDGMPVFSGSPGGVSNSETFTSANALGDINPNDIESIEILKDGAATAIYGSRGANGVILITTKKGKGGRFTVGFNNQTTVASVAKYFDLLETPEFLEISGEKGVDWAKGNEFNTDWQKAVLRTAIQTDNSLSFSGGMEKGKYFSSIGYTTQEGIIKANSMERFTAKFSADQKFTNKVTVGINFNFAKTNYSGLNNRSNGLSGVMYNSLKQLPNTPIYDPTNPTGYNIKKVGRSSVVGKWDNPKAVGNRISNIVMVLNTNKRTSEITRILGNGFANIKFTNWLDYRFQISADNMFVNELRYDSMLHGDGYSAGGRVIQQNQNFLRWNLQNVLTLNKSFDDHRFVLTLINEYQKQDRKSFWGRGQGLSDDHFGTNLISGSYTTQASGGGRSSDGFISYAGRFNYSFGGRYFLQGSLRYDGLSKLPEDKRWGLFPGVSAGWNIAKESFLSGSIFSELKVKASWAKTGNTSLGGSYPYLGLYANERYGNNTGLGYTQAGNSDLGWETSVKKDIGLDMSVLNNRLSVNFDYYINDIDNLVLERKFPPVAGVPNNKIFQNVGRIVNSGFEVGVNANVMNKKNFSWDINANVTTVNNKIETLIDNSDIFYHGGRRINRVGESMNSLYGYKYYGVNKANGNPIYYKKDGTLVQREISNGKVSKYKPDSPLDMSEASTLKISEDGQILGRSIPLLFGGITNAFRIGDFDVSALIRYSYGNKIMNLTRTDLMSMEFVNNSKEILGRWQSPDKPGDGKTPRIAGGRNARVNDDGVGSSRFVEDASFIKFDNLSIGYNFDKNSIENAGLSKLRVFVQAQNFLVFTNYSGADPELNTNGIDHNSIPRQHSFTLGVNASF